MIFVLLVGQSRGLLRFECTSVEMLLDTFRDKLHESAGIIDDVGHWAIHAEPGAWLDWPGGYVFAVEGNAEIIVGVPAQAQRH